MTLKPSAICLAALLGLAGCTIGSGPPYRVQTQSASGITILTDPALRNLSQVQQVARSHCASFGKQAVQARVSNNLRGGRAAVYFACR
ncbi:hypothetical protein ACELLULO517_10555 [Acidisoma cellulosilytica]|uniref:Lipoprotein n=1 Tax=Acidisoma cellulosilyticum TaxID=2802395 RepID=A0A963Z0M0_9PROT|nr:hypothetical protein [Acidisoma cellulosilyticum]MCB8880672.1 hypothetical protein [Acidisoma cellulosilyticum]